MSCHTVKESDGGRFISELCAKDSIYTSRLVITNRMNNFDGLYVVRLLTVTGFTWKVLITEEVEYERNFAIKRL